MEPTALPPPDHLFNFVTELGAALAGGAVLGGATLAFLYGRRASAAISAEVHPTPAGFVVSTRPTVKAVGVFRVKFQEGRGVVVRLTEVVVDDNGDLQENDNAWEHEGAFDQQFVDPGEELTTSVTFGPILPEPSVVGWMVYLRVTAPTRFARVRAGWWSDQVFLVPPWAEG